MKHWETHTDIVEGCKPCKWTTIGLSSAGITRERKGQGPMGDNGTREYVHKMFSDRRGAGMADPIPENAEARKYMPAVGVHGGRKYREANGGL